jgi:hypothetical protein
VLRDAGFPLADAPRGGYPPDAGFASANWRAGSGRMRGESTFLSIRGKRVPINKLTARFTTFLDQDHSLEYNFTLDATSAACRPDRNLP